MEKIKTYYPFMDGLKGLAILLMVMAHALAWSYPDISFLSQRLGELAPNEFNSALLWKLIYSFHMSLLFFVSGFLFYRDIQYSWKNSISIIKKRILRILIPYIITGGFVLFLKGYFGYWFLQILFIVNIIVVLEYTLLHYLKASWKIEFIAHIIIYIALFIFSKFANRYTLPAEICNISVLSNYYLAFIIGCILRQYPNVLCAITNQLYGFVFFVLYIFLFIIINSSYHIPLIGILIPVFAIFYLVNVFQKIDYRNTIIGRALMIIGKNSLEVYILHLFFLMPFQQVGIFIIQQNNFAVSFTLQIVYSLILSIIAIVLSIVVARFIKLNHILSKLIFGV